MKNSSSSFARFFAAISALAICASACSADQTAQPSAAEQQPEAVDISEPAAVVTEPAAMAPETVLVSVDDVKITQADVDGEKTKAKALMEKAGLSDEQLEVVMANMDEQLLEMLVSKTLINNEFTKQKMAISEGDIKAEIENIKANLPQGTSLNSLIEHNGLTEADFEAGVLDQLKLKKLLKIPEPTEEQVKDYFEENKDYFEMPETMKARHILIKTDKKESDEEKASKREKAESIRKQLLEGADFAKLAEEHSDCPSGARGGSLGNVRRGQMVPEFEKATFKLKAGEMSDIVETDFGYHIIEALEHNEAKSLQLEEAASRIKLALTEEAFYGKLPSFLEELKKKAVIVYNEDLKRDKE